MFGIKKNEKMKATRKNKPIKEMIALYNELKDAKTTIDQLKQEKEALEKALDASRGCVKGEWCETCEYGSRAPGSWGFPGKLVCSGKPKCRNYVRKQAKAGE